MIPDGIRTAPTVRRGLVGAFVAALVSFPLPAASQVNNPAYADYFLVGRFGEICTMCEAIVLCESGVSDAPRERIPAEGSFALYHLQTRTFWSQIATIWAWFVANFDSASLAATGHTRPVDVYTVAKGRWSAPVTVAARISLEPPRIVIGGQAIDRVDQFWLQEADARRIGYCQRLPLWESLDIIAARSPGSDS